MAKKNFGKFLALAALSGAVAAGVSYFLKYQSFHKELDEDFHDFEGVFHSGETRGARASIGLRSGGDDDVVAIADVGIAAGKGNGPIMEGRAVGDVHGYALGPFCFRIDQDELVDAGQLRKKECRRAPDPTNSDDADSYHKSLLSSNNRNYVF